MLNNFDDLESHDISKMLFITSLYKIGLVAAFEFQVNYRDVKYILKDKKLEN